MGRGVTK